MNHVVLVKLGVADQVQAVMMALPYGLVDLSDIRWGGIEFGLARDWLIANMPLS